MQNVTNNDVAKLFPSGEEPIVSTSAHPILWRGAPVAAAPTVLWDLDNLQITKVWSRFGVKGQNVNVYVLDSGYDPHVAMAHHQVMQISFVPNLTPLDRLGHGTWCAGKIAAQGVGIAPRCNLTVVKVLDDAGTGSSKWSIEGLKWVARQPEPHVVSMSLGAPSKSRTEESIIDELWDKGCIVVAASGNQNSGEPFYPAAYPHTLAVTALDQAARRAGFANYGPQVDIATAGVDCYGTYLQNQFRQMSGTSMATPVVAGVVALGWSLLLTQDRFVNRQSARDRILTALQQTARDLGAPGRDAYYGNGSVDAVRFLEMLTK